MHTNNKNQLNSLYVYVCICIYMYMHVTIAIKENRVSIWRWGIEELLTGGMGGIGGRVP